MDAGRGRGMVGRGRGILDEQQFVQDAGRGRGRGVLPGLQGKAIYLFIYLNKRLRKEKRNDSMKKEKKKRKIK